MLSPLADFSYKIRGLICDKTFTLEPFLVKGFLQKINFSNNLCVSFNLKQNLNLRFDHV